MRQLLPAPSADVALLDAYAYPEPRDRVFVRANMVGSTDGAAQVQGRSEGLGSDPDKAVFDALRTLADVVLVGAGTVRVEGYRAFREKPERTAARTALGLAEPVPRLAVVSRRLDLDPSSALFDASRARTIVLTTSSSPADGRAALAEVADVEEVGDAEVDVDAALDALDRRGLRRVLCEGGPTLLGAVVTAGRLDELCLTVAPLLVGGSATRILDGPVIAAPLRLAHLLEQDGVLLTRYAVS